MHTIRIIVAVIFLIVACFCFLIGISEVKEETAEAITKFLVAVFLCLLAVALILK